MLSDDRLLLLKVAGMFPDLGPEGYDHYMETGVRDCSPVWGISQTTHRPEDELRISAGSGLGVLNLRYP